MRIFHHYIKIRHRTCLYQWGNQNLVEQYRSFLPFNRTGLFSLYVEKIPFFHFKPARRNGMNITESQWQTPDGVNIYTREWLPDEDPRASVVLVHGLGEHCARYDHVAAVFAKNNIRMQGFDLRGHGKTDGQRGHIPSFELAMRDIDHFISQAMLTAKGKPVILYGHSMGGAMVLYYALLRKPKLTGIISTSPGIATGTPVNPVTLAVGQLLYNFAPSFTLPNGLDVNNLSHDPDVIQAYKKDPLVTPKVSARLGLDVINNGKYILDHAGEFTLPLLLMQGSNDHIVSPEATWQFSRRVPPSLITYKLWEGLDHETHNEYERDQVIQTMVDWICQFK
jgi:alpha-beta hydrolase superfamily lysophospholipase